jgi:hypothetical protein
MSASFRRGSSVVGVTGIVGGVWHIDAVPVRRQISRSRLCWKSMQQLQNEPIPLSDLTFGGASRYPMPSGALCYELPIAMPAMNTKTPPTTT